MSGFEYDKVEDFDDLRIILRRTEKRQLARKPKETKSSKPVSARAVQASSDDDIRCMLQKLTADVESLKKSGQSFNNNSNNNSSSNNNNGKNNWKGKRGISDQQPQQQQRHYDDRSSRNYDRSTRQHGSQHSTPRQQNDQHGPCCYRCGQEGHVAVGCRVRLDHVRKPQDF